MKCSIDAQGPIDLKGEGSHILRPEKYYAFVAVLIYHSADVADRDVLAEITEAGIAPAGHVSKPCITEPTFFVRSFASVDSAVNSS